MVAKQQSNIDELVTKNRSLEQTITKLRADVTAEKAKTEAAVQREQEQHKAEQAEWKEGCDSLQSLWRIAHLRAVVDLEKEKTTAFKLKEDMRLERLARLQRDFQIGQFQAREAELENRLQELTLEIGEKDRRQQDDIATLEGTVEELRKEAEERDEKLEDAIQAKNQLEKTLATLRKDHAALLASSSSGGVDLERTTLQVEGLKSSLAELQEKYSEMQAKNKDLLRQLEKWRNMENREGEELETIRKRKIELDIQVKDYEQRLAEAEEAQTQLKAKYQTRIQQYKASLDDHARALDEANKELDERDTDVEELQRKLAEAEEKVAKLGSKPKASSSKVPASPKQKKKSTVEEFDDDVQLVDDHIHSSPTPPPPPPPPAKPANKPKPRPVKKKAPQPAARDGSDSDIELVGESSHSRKEPEPSNFEFDGFGEEDEVEDAQPPPKSKGKGKAIASSEPAKKPRGRPKKQKPPSPEPDDVQEEAPASSSGKKGKRKANGKDDTALDSQRPKKKGKKVAAGSDSDDVPLSKPATKKKEAAPASKAKGKAREASPPRLPESDSGEGLAVQKKKKRKINIFNSADVAPPFDFKSFSSGTDGGLNIPLELSPVKPGEQAPSVLGKALAGGRR
ncbi:hypothetical protein PsYK624_046660 [Phanerochaete sordida]|uniref:Uncharacterized protein n=1 Tax=Phanerochaete sordida TaxID=48140 RepID=A0A9P3G5C9_9APHY|nr:hypothetical protein PsYK624_046660 [Phanerochaete sordida]